MSKPAFVPILDVRAEASFAAGHAPGAVNIPLEQLAQRVHELPPKGSTVILFDEDSPRLHQAAAALRSRGYPVAEASLSPGDLPEQGPSRAKLWQPNPFLVEALDRIQAMDRIQALGAAGAPPGRALDLACGAGRDAAYLAMRGYQVDAIDVLPDALKRAGDLAARCGVHLNLILQDLKRHPVLPAGGYGLVAVFRFLHRPALPSIGQSVAPGGFIVYETFHWRDPRQGGKPLKPSHALQDGELAAAFDGFEPLIARDGLQRDGRCLCQLLARRKASP